MAGAIFLGTVTGGVVSPPIPESPCPQVFQYHSHVLPGDTSATVSGLVTLYTSPLGVMLNLLIHLQLQAVLPSKYVGLVEFAGKSNTTLWNQTAAFLYKVRFPLVKPLPTVRLISVNDEVICTGPQARGPVVTDIRLEHTLRRLAVPNTTPPSQGTMFNIDPGGQCGRAVVANPLVVGGRQLQRGEWPWLTAVFVLNPLGLEFHCSGSIITRTFILTVGHCMRHEEAGIMKPGDVVVYLGKFNLTKWEEPHSTIKEVEEIHIHPEFDANKYIADLALLRLSSPAEYNMFVQPVCLWSRPTDLHLIVGQMGTVAGWGRDHPGNKMSATPRVIEIPIVSTQECVDSHSEFVFLTSPTTLCAGARDGLGPCNGDSGGGLLLPISDGDTTRWHLRGLVSLSLLNTTTQACDLNQYIVFTDAAKFIPWIESIVNSKT